MNPIIMAYETLIAFVPVLIVWGVIFTIWLRLGGMKTFELWAKRIEKLDELLDEERKEE